MGYNFAHLSRLERGHRAPDPSVVAATFISALDLAEEPAWAARLVELADVPLGAVARSERYVGENTSVTSGALLPGSAEARASMGAREALEQIPRPGLHEVARPAVVARLHARLLAEGHGVLCGLAGIGKTTVAAALAREYARSVPVFWLTLAERAESHAEKGWHPLCLRPRSWTPLASPNVAGVLATSHFSVRVIGRGPVTQKPALYLEM